MWSAFLLNMYRPVGWLALEHSSPQRTRVGRMILFRPACSMRTRKGTPTSCLETPQKGKSRLRAAAVGWKGHDSMQNATHDVICAFHPSSLRESTSRGGSMFRRHTFVSGFWRSHSLSKRASRPGRALLATHAGLPTCLGEGLQICRARSLCM